MVTTTVGWETQADQAQLAERIAMQREMLPTVHMMTLLEAKIEAASQLSTIRRLLAKDLAGEVHDQVEIAGLLRAEKRLKYELTVLSRAA